MKLDLFMDRLCKAPFVLICDDDLFLLNSQPITWAISELERNTNLAVVSLYPRKKVTDALRGKISEAMGSYCLLIRREIWEAENISFQSDYSPYSQGHFWFYDTADYAHVELVQRGYEVLIAPQDIQSQLVTLEGISTWALKIQKYRGHILNNIVEIKARQEKAYRTILFLRGIREMFPQHITRPVVQEQFLRTAETIISSLLEPNTLNMLQEEVNITLARIQEAGYLSVHA